MIDHQARAEVRQTVNEFLSDRIGSFEFDDKIHEIAYRTRDRTVVHVICKLWYTYSDTRDHLVHLDKRSWDTVQRLLLLLDSESEVRQHRVWMWHSSQGIAAAGLIALGDLAWSSQGSLWWLCLFLSGAISIALKRSREQVRASFQKPDPWRTWPFPTIEALRRALDRNPKFQKQKHRPEIANRRIEPRWNNVQLPSFIEWPLSRIGWCIVSPLILLFQCSPLSIGNEEFVEPKGGLASAA